MTCDIFDYGEYLQRNKIETCNAMFKKRFSSNSRSRIDKTMYGCHAKGGIEIAQHQMQILLSHMFVLVIRNFEGYQYNH